MKEKLKLKAIENQMVMDFSPLMVKYGIYDQSDLREFMSKVSINTPKQETVEEYLNTSKRLIAYNHDDNKKEVTIVHATELMDGSNRYMDVDGNYYSFVEEIEG